MQKPISIDDMFSFVTERSGWSPNNAQRPYKYASLENIVCLTPACSTAPLAANARPSTAGAAIGRRGIADSVANKKYDAIETYLQKYPETKKRGELLSKIGSLRRSEFTEWTLFEIGNKHNAALHANEHDPTIRRQGGGKNQNFGGPKVAEIFYGKSIPDAAYRKVYVYDCTTPVTAIAERSIFDKSGEPSLSIISGRDPQYLNIGSE